MQEITSEQYAKAVELFEQIEVLKARLGQGGLTLAQKLALKSEINKTDAIRHQVLGV